MSVLQDAHAALWSSQKDAELALQYMREAREELEAGRPRNALAAITEAERALGRDTEGTE